MKRISNFWIAFVFCLPFLLSTACESCNKRYKFHTNFMTFRFYDKATHDGLKYNYDTVNVINDQGQVVSISPIRQDGLIVAYPFTDEDEQYLDQLITRNYYLYLNHQDTDTIELTYSASLGDCNDIYLTQIGISYNDSVYWPLQKGSRLPYMKFYKERP